MAHGSLKDFVAILQQAETVPRPGNETWQALIERISAFSEQSRR